MVFWWGHSRNGSRVAVKYFMVESSEAGVNDPTFKAFKTELELIELV